MNLPEPLKNLFHPKTTRKELYLSLTFLHSSVAACAWSIDGDGMLSVVACDSVKIKTNTWESRIESSDALIAELAKQTGLDTMHQVVFGLPQDMLTESGDIEKTTRPYLKKLSSMLELKPVGFVNIDTAVVFQIKHDEGVPPSVILMHVAGDIMSVSLYRVGTSLGTKQIHINEFVVEDVETAIKSFENVEVLPSRMILYGEDKTVLDGIQSQLLTYQWPNKANFLHYPKIDSLPLTDISRAVALAGASELARAMGLETVTEEEVTLEKEETVVAQTPTLTEEAEVEKHESPNEEYIEIEQKKNEPKEDFISSIDEAFDKTSDEGAVSNEQIDVHPEDANVVSVPPETLGFSSHSDTQESVKEPYEQGEKGKDIAPTASRKIAENIKRVFSTITSFFSKIHIPHVQFSGAAIPLTVMAIIGICIAGLLYLFVPQVTVTLAVVPNSVTKEKNISISTAVTTVDAEKFVIPGKKLEQTVTGEKIIPVTGKKRIGNPAQGAVTFYNKTTTVKNLKKGVIITTGTLQFTLDSDVEVASASESIGSLTYGKTNAAVTATAIGEEGNLGAGKEFEVKGYDTDVLSARNDQPFTGGKSREAIVVTRVDYDNLVKVLTEELVVKAKADLAGSVTGEEKLIDQTIKTAVTAKTFTEELDQEANQLHGKVSLTISGITYNEADVKGILMSLASKDIPSGYVVNEGRTKITIVNPVLKKDGSITAVASILLASIPRIDVLVLQKQLAGKSVKTAEVILKQMQGIGSAELFFRRSLGKTMLPIRPTNITIDVVISE